MPGISPGFCSFTFSLIALVARRTAGWRINYLDMVRMAGIEGFGGSGERGGEMSGARGDDGGVRLEDEILV